LSAAKVGIFPETAKQKLKKLVWLGFRAPNICIYVILTELCANILVIPKECRNFALLNEQSTAA